MNRKILTLLIVLITAISIASVCAAELTKVNDFDGKFKMNISDNSTFEQVVDDVGQNAFLSNQSWSDNKTAVVCYYENSIDSLIPKIKSNTLFMSEPKTEGNLTILENTVYGDGNTEAYSFKYFVGTTSPENKTVFIASNDLNLAKEYANTIVFS